MECLPRIFMLSKKPGMVQVELIKDADFFKGAASDEFVFSKVLIP